MDKRWKNKIVDVLFYIVLVIKGIDGILELISGALLLWVEPERLNSIARSLTQHELNQDPDDFFANLLRDFVHHISSDIKLFAAIYLLVHGVIKLGLVAALLNRILWAFPTAITVFVFFLGYQLYRYSHTYSTGMLVLSGIDVVVIVLACLEWRRLQEETH